MKRAILQVCDTGPLESLVVMLRAANYECFLPGAAMRSELRQVCGKRGLVLDVDSLMKSMGYERPFALPEATPAMMRTADLYADVKAHRVYGDIVAHWPNLAGKVLWYRINGGEIEHVIKSDGEDCGDEGNPPCPVLTPNMHYREPGSWSDRAYVMWPPFVRFDEYNTRHGRGDGWKKNVVTEEYKMQFSSPVCLIHNLNGWGYGRLVDNLRALDVCCYGAGSPDGLMPHHSVPGILAGSLAMVHLKSSDAPGYALYEALAAACPVVCTRRLIWRCRMQDLLIPGETCLVFDRETHEGLTDDDVRDCTAEVAGHLERLRDPVENARIGMAGRERLRQVMWSAERSEDVASLREFLGRCFP